MTTTALRRAEPETRVERENRGKSEQVRSMTDDELWAERARAANAYMVYAVQPLTEHANHTARANALRAAHKRSYASLWLALDNELTRRLHGGR